MIQMLEFADKYLIITIFKYVRWFGEKVYKIDGKNQRNRNFKKTPNKTKQNQNGNSKNWNIQSKNEEFIWFAQQHTGYSMIKD